MNKTETYLTIQVDLKFLYWRKTEGFNELADKDTGRTGR